MDKKQYNELIQLSIYLVGIIVGIAISIFAVVWVSAEENSTNSTNVTVIINNSYYYNQTFIYNYTINQTFVYNYTNNQTINATIYYNITNISYINCTIDNNFTNVTNYVNYTNITQFFNGTKFEPEKYYLKTEADERVETVNSRLNEFLLKSDYTPNKWRDTDTYIFIAIGILALGTIFSLFVIFRSMSG